MPLAKQVGLVTLIGEDGAVAGGVDVARCRGRAPKAPEVGNMPCTEAIKDAVGLDGRCCEPSAWKPLVEFRPREGRAPLLRRICFVDVNARSWMVRRGLPN